MLIAWMKKYSIYKKILYYEYDYGTAVERNELYVVCNT